MLMNILKIALWKKKKKIGNTIHLLKEKISNEIKSLKNPEL